MIFTIDVEDWTQSVLNNKNPVTDRVLHNTLRVLDMLDEYGHKATFFTLGNVAKKHPKLIRRIAEAGHEIASHGFHHDSIFTLSKEQIFEDVSTSVKLLEDTSGQKVLGYRAPDFSIRESLFEWYCEALAANGLRYDSSLFPMKVFKYGIEKRYSLDIFDKHGINEHYLSYMKFGEQKLPFFGGGYFRLMPYSMTKKLTSQLDSKSAVFYMHPYEVDTDELAYVKSTGQKIPLKWRLSQFIGRNTVKQKIHKLMGDFKFNSFANEYYLEGAASIAQHTLSNIEEGSVHVPQPEIAYDKVTG
ncbi:MAG: polysaccharide deacetylase family protein [Cocleimonas sp.]